MLFNVFKKGYGTKSRTKTWNLEECVDPDHAKAKGPRKASHSVESTQAGECARMDVYQHQSRSRGDDILYPIDDPDNLLTCDAMFKSSDVSLLGADLQALIHSCDPTQLGAQISPLEPAVE